MAFALDTSRTILTPWPTKGDPEGKSTSMLNPWRDLSPFAQGYGSAMAKALYDALRAVAWSHEDAERAVAFRRWAPEALEMILRDCERFERGWIWTLGDDVFPTTEENRDERLRAAGKSFWAHRSTLFFAHAFPPLTPYLAEDGKVHLREGGL